MNFEQIKTKVQENSAINREEALWLLTEADLLDVGKLADGIRQKNIPKDGSPMWSIATSTTRMCANQNANLRILPRCRRQRCLPSES